MTGRKGDFNKQITNARNSNEDFEVNIPEEDVNVAGKQHRTSAALLQKAITHGTGTKKNFTTIQPQGLPPDLIGNEANLVERQNVLTEPRGHKNEGSRLPPFKPFKTISDEDNIHLLPGETGERARLNLLDTKTVTKKDVDEVRTAYYKQRELYPELYNKQQLPVEQPVQAAPADPQKKKGFLNKLFSKKKSIVQVPPPSPPKPPIIPKEEPKPPSPTTPRKSVAPAPPHIKSESTRHSEQRQQHTLSKAASTRTSRYQKKSSYLSSSESSSSSSSSSDESEEQYPSWGNWMQPYNYNGYPSPQYPGFPGGFSPFFNQAYAGGFGPMQTPCYNPCMEEIMLERCKRIMKDKGRGFGDEENLRGAKKISKKPQGLNFDFLPHDDLATEVTMTIEPDEPEPLQYAVENGIMPIICCYMPSSIAVQPQSEHYSQTQQRYPSTYPDGSYQSYQYHGDSENSPAQTSQNALDETEQKETESQLTDAEEESLPDIMDDVGDGNLRQTEQT